jgi:hypothetical protein
VKHQGACGQTLIHTETCLYDRYRCESCGIEWTKRKRRRPGLADNECTWQVPCASHPASRENGHVEYPETHEAGYIELHNLDEVQYMLRDREVNDLGIHIANDGRAWLCINGIAFIRFKPDRKIWRIIND